MIPGRLWFWSALVVNIALACGDAPGDVIVPAAGAPSTLPDPSPTGAGKECNADAGCGGQGPGAVTCMTPEDCTPAKPICERGMGVCVQCMKNSDCPATSPVCSPPQHACVICQKDTDCSASERCDPTLRRCAASCAKGKACPPDAPICDSSLELCVSCRTNADCPDMSTPDCLNGRCTNCSSGACP